MKPIHKNAAREEVRKPDVAWLRVGRVEPVPVVVGHGDVKEQNCRAGAGIARSINTEPGLGTCCRDFWSCRQHHPLAISQFLDAKIRLRNRAEPGTFGGVCARSRHNYEPGILGGGEASASSLSHHRRQPWYSDCLPISPEG